MGRYGLGERNENDDRFANLCAFNKMVIDGTIFPYKRIHKAAWVSPNHTRRNRSAIFASVKSSKGQWRGTRRGADIASDHHQLAVAKIASKLKKQWTTGETTLERFNTDVFQHTDKLKQFYIVLNNRFLDLQDLLKEEKTTMEDSRKGIK